MTNSTKDRISLHTLYHKSASASWVVEKYGVHLFNENTESTLFLAYPEAALWELMSQGYSILRAEVLLARIFSMEPEEVQQTMQEALERWVEEGFIQKETHG